MAALIGAHAGGDTEGVHAIVGSVDERRLIERLLEAVLLLGMSRYGSRAAMAAAMHDTVTFIATFAPGTDS